MHEGLKMWRAGALSGHKDYEIHDELLIADGRCVAVIECFVTNPMVYYCNAITPAAQRWLRVDLNFDTTRDWAERVAGLKPDRPITPSGP
jgi:hypothetical protein